MAKVYIPETRKLMAKKQKLWSTKDDDGWLYVSQERNILNDEVNALEKEIEEKYLSVGPINVHSLGVKFNMLSVEDYVLYQYEIKDFFKFLTSRKKDIGLYDASTKYTKLLTDNGIEVMYTKYPNRRNVVKKADIDRLVEMELALDIYYD